MEIDGVRIRKELHTMITHAEVDLEMWLAMSGARRDDDVIRMLNQGYGRFYLAAENALLNSMIVILYKVLEKNPKTINFWSLRLSLIGTATPEQLLELDAALASIKKMWTRISVIRNNVVGHQALDKTAEESHQLAGLKVEHARAMVVSCQELLFRIARDFHDTHVVFNIKGTESFYKLLSDLRSWDATKRR